MITGNAHLKKKKISILQNLSIFQSAKMANSEKSKLKCAIEVFYLQKPKNDRKLTTYHEFKDSKLNGRLAFTKRGLYKMRIKKCVHEIDMDMIIKMFENLPPKIVKAKNNGLESLL